MDERTDAMNHLHSSSSSSSSFSLPGPLVHDERACLLGAEEGGANAPAGDEGSPLREDGKGWQQSRLRELSVASLPPADVNMTAQRDGERSREEEREERKEDSEVKGERVETEKELEERGEKASEEEKEEETPRQEKQTQLPAAGALAKKSEDEKSEVGEVLGDGDRRQETQMTAGNGDPLSSAAIDEFSLDQSETAAENDDGRSPNGENDDRTREDGKRQRPQGAGESEQGGEMKNGETPLNRYHRSFGDPFPSPKRLCSNQDAALHLPEDVDGCSMRYNGKHALSPSSFEAQKEDFFASSPPRFPPESASSQTRLSRLPLLSHSSEQDQDLPSPPLSPVARYEEETGARLASVRPSSSSSSPSPSSPSSSVSASSLSPAEGSTSLCPPSSPSASAAPASPALPEFPERRETQPFEASLRDDLLPSVANAENRRLHGEMVEFLDKTRALNLQIAEREERTKLMEIHLRQLLAEVKTLAGVADAKREAAQTESHVADLHSRHLGKVASEKKNVENQIAAQQERLLSVQAHLLASSEKVDKFKLQMNWNEEELKQWVAAEKRKQDDRLEVERLQRADEREVKQLKLQIEKLSVEVQREKLELYQKATDAKTLKLELQAATKQFRCVQEDRRQVIEQWEAALEGMKQRDESLKDAAARYGIAQEEVRQKLEKLGRLRSFTAEQQSANDALQREVHQLEKKLEKFRGEFAAAKTRLAAVHEAGEALRAELAAARAQVARDGAEVEHLTLSLETKRQALAALTERREQAKRQLDKELLHSKEKDDVLRQTESFCRRVETTYNHLETQVKKSHEELFEACQQFASQATINRTTQAEIQSSQAALRNLG
ncbi:hypothetical protein TGARI_218188A, partial [Toxoplasma gondii ARI]